MHAPADSTRLDPVTLALVQKRVDHVAERMGQVMLKTARSPIFNQSHDFSCFLTDGRVEIDNNLVENAIRPTALGKKNWLFIGEANAGGRSAILYTLIESCRRRGIEPYAYLREVLTRLPHMTNRQIPAVIPAAWGKTRRQEQPLAAS